MQPVDADHEPPLPEMLTSRDRMNAPTFWTPGTTGSGLICGSLAELVCPYPMAKLISGLSRGVLCVDVCMTKPKADRIGREVPIG